MASVFNAKPPVPPQRPQPRLNWHWSIWLLLGGVGLVGFLILTGMMRQHTFDDGMHAYDTGDCATAIAKFDQVIGNSTSTSSDPTDLSARAKAKKVECQAFEAAKNPKQTVTTRFVNATKFVQQYPESGLKAPLQQVIAPMAQKTSAKNLATPTTCQRLDLVQTNQLVPGIQMPQLYQACGEVFTSTKKFPQAIALYEKFLDQFPNHPLTNNIKQAYAKAIVKDAKAQKGGTIAAPGLTGRTADGSTVVSIRNDSTEAMRIVFSGATPRVEELPACTNCQDFTKTTIPKTCPEKGEIGKYTVQPGEYEVMVKSVGKRNVKPFTGTWALEPGSEYGHCFYIVKDAGI